MLQLWILNVADMSFNAIRENKILTKICEFTVKHIKAWIYRLNSREWKSVLMIFRLLNKPNDQDLPHFPKM